MGSVKVVILAQALLIHDNSFQVTRMLRAAVLDDFVDGLPLTVLVLVLALAAIGVLVAVIANTLSFHLGFVYTALVINRNFVVYEIAAKVGVQGG